MPMMWYFWMELYASSTGVSRGLQLVRKIEKFEIQQKFRVKFLNSFFLLKTISQLILAIYLNGFFEGKAEGMNYDLNL